LDTESQTLIECVLNLSEGRNLKKIEELSEAIEVVDGCEILHRDIGWDANRSVFTIVGGINEVLDGIEKALVFSLSNFNIRNHSGEHPYVGILDVIPFVPLQGIDPQELRSIVHRYCKYIAATYNISILAYGELSSNPSLMTLAYIRRGGLQKLESRLATKELKIDYGVNRIHELLGISCVTVRPIMIAFNINLKTQDLSKTKEIAKELRRIRETDSRLKDVRFLAWKMETFSNCQISMNIYDIKALSMLTLMNVVHDVAEKHSIELNGSEMIGMAPEYAFSHLELPLSDTIALLGLDSLSPFLPEKRILDFALGRKIV